MDGKATAATVLSEIADRVRAMKERGAVVPGLAVLCVGDRADSLKYVSMKENTAKKVGFHSVTRHLPKTASQEQVEQTLAEFSADSKIHGILVQLPLPSHLNQALVLSKLDIRKDVDGFHPFNVGCFALKHSGDFAPWESDDSTTLASTKPFPSNGDSSSNGAKSVLSAFDEKHPEHKISIRELADVLDVDKDGALTKRDLNDAVSAAVNETLQSSSGNIACTPKACLELLRRYGVGVKGKHAVVLGRSNIVGMPVSLLLMHSDATVTNCTVHSKNIESLVRSADIVISATGHANLVRGSWIKPGAAVIDVGINVIHDKGVRRVVGDVCFEEARAVAGFLTPVPGGVGPMTVAMLMDNTLRNAESLCSPPA